MFQSVFEKAATDNKEVQNWLADVTKTVFAFQQNCVNDFAEWSGAASVRSYSAKTVQELVEVNLSNLSEFSERSSRALLGTVDIVNTLTTSNPFLAGGSIGPTTVTSTDEGTTSNTIKNSKINKTKSS